MDNSEGIKTETLNNILKRKKSKSINYWIFVTILLFIIFVGLFTLIFIWYHEEPEQKAIPQYNNVDEVDPFEGMTKYEAGQYEVGTDMHPGEYVILSTSDSGYFSVSKDTNENEIIFNSVFENNSIATVNKNEYLTLSNSIAILSSDYYKEYTMNLDNFGTMLKVGKDIRPGKYKLWTSGDDGYYCIFSSSRQDDIIDNGIFENSSYVTVKKGEYLQLSNCIIEK